MGPWMGVVSAVHGASVMDYLALLQGTATVSSGHGMGVARSTQLSHPRRT